MNRKLEQGDATRRRLVRAAVALFTERGFAEASTARIVARAEVTRGALYHHFADKERLFEAAFVEIEKDIFARCAAAAAAAGDDPLARLSAGADAFLDACLDPAVQRILLLEGPSQLGWERSLRFDDPHCARRLLIAGLSAAADAGLLPAGRVTSLAHLLYGALNQAGIVIAAADDPAAERIAMTEAVGTLLTALLRPRDGDGAPGAAAATPGWGGTDAGVAGTGHSG